VANRTLGEVDDLSRLLRQVHRVLRSGHPFVIVVDHPFAEVFAHTDRPYGTRARTLGEWLTALNRSNFRADVVHELGTDPTGRVPTTLVIRAHKEGS